MILRCQILRGGMIQKQDDIVGVFVEVKGDLNAEQKDVDEEQPDWLGCDDCADGGYGWRGGCAGGTGGDR